MKKAKQLLDKARIGYLKAIAKDNYIAYFHTFSGGAGHALSEVISRDKMTYKQKFNETMDELAKLDPNCPKERL
jgi:hypothetical protein